MFGKRSKFDSAIKSEDWRGYKAKDVKTILKTIAASAEKEMCAKAIATETGLPIETVSRLAFMMYGKGYLIPRMPEDRMLFKVNESKTI